MPPVGFEPTISAVERPQTYALDRAATGTGFLLNYDCKTTNIKTDNPAFDICTYSELVISTSPIWYRLTLPAFVVIK